MVTASPGWRSKGLLCQPSGNTVTVGVWLLLPLVLVSTTLMPWTSPRPGGSKSRSAVSKAVVVPVFSMVAR